MNILVIFTGGTIGSVIKDGWISTDTDTKHVLINKYRILTNDTETNFIPITPYSILSENLSSNELNILGKCILNNIHNNYDGIIVTHGTDTIQYTAAALSYMLQGINIPVVLVSSDFPLEKEYSNGVANFCGAVNFIKSNAGNGVYVSYKNDNEKKVNIHIGTRISSHQEMSANLYSIDNNPYAFFESNEIHINNNFKPSKTSSGIGLVEFSQYPHILMIDSHPGDDYTYNLDNYDVVILSPYHSATINTENKKLIEFCKIANKKNIPIFLVNATEGITYESSQIFADLNLKILPFCNKISIYVKCWIALSQNRNIEEFIKSPIAQEFYK